jgi:hypothetical protein
MLSEAKDLAFLNGYEILPSLRSLRMTVLRTFAEVSDCDQGDLVQGHGMMCPSLGLASLLHFDGGHLLIIPTP